MNSSLRVWRVDLHLTPSRIFLTLILLLHLAAIMALVQAGLPVVWRAPVFFLILLSGVISLRQEKQAQHFLLREQSTIWWLATGEWQGPASLQHVRVWRYLVVMDFLCRQDGKVWRRRVMVFPDSVSAGSFRRLRVRLRYGLPLQQPDIS